MITSPPSSTRRCLVLIRHGQSEANRANQFTGRRESPLTALGRDQATIAGRRLTERGTWVGAAFCSTLSRTAMTADLVLAALGQSDLAPEPTAALDERDYGALSGLDKTTVHARWGAEQIERWRRSYAEAPPGGESLRDTLARVLPDYLRRIQPAAMSGTALVVAHGNSLRALVMALEGLSPTQVEGLELPTGSIRLYTLGADTAITSREILT